MVAESIRFYGDHFGAVLLLGLPFVALDVLSIDQPWRRQSASRPRSRSSFSQ